MQHGPSVQFDLDTPVVYVAPFAVSIMPALTYASSPVKSHATIAWRSRVWFMVSLHSVYLSLYM